MARHNKSEKRIHRAGQTSNTDPNGGKASTGGSAPGFFRGSPDGQTLADLEAYPLLTEEIGYAPSPVSSPIQQAPPIPGQPPLGQIALKAVSDVLGWKGKQGDSKGFVGALNQSFDLQDIQGHTQATWKPRTYAVQSDLSGGITGAQASIYSRAKEFLEKSLPLLDGIYTLDMQADPGDTEGLREVLRSQMTELVNELGVLGGPRVPRVNQYFTQMLGLTPPITSGTTVNPDPDGVKGTLGEFRDLLGLATTKNFVNTVEDEENQTNYRLLSDYMTSLAQTWINNLQFFERATPNTSTTPFFGTQLVLLSRQLSVVAESVDEVRFAMDSVFIGPAERQTLLLNFGPRQSSMFIEELLSWVQAFCTDEGPMLIEKAGKLGVGFGFIDSVKTLIDFVDSATRLQRNINSLPPGFYTARVLRSWRDLLAQLKELGSLATPVGRKI